ncbi:response regulator [Dechloromonas agitata]|uniref:response regulator n=1 Tax=Dechloromonas agitata TaxID=73030 RepID=UPI00055B091E|nr:response regulator [Dechloromonas agitata]
MRKAKFALVVDDSLVSRELVGRVLEKLGWTVSLVEDGYQALILLQSRNYDIIFLDLSMPGISGEETCKKIRALPHGRASKIIAYTAHAYADDHPRLLAEGFDRILIKPVSVQAFADVIVDLDKSEQR